MFYHTSRMTDGADVPHVIIKLLCLLEGVLDVDGGVDDEAEGDEGAVEAGAVGGIGEEKKHQRAGDVGRFGVEVRSDGGVAEADDGDGEEGLCGWVGHGEPDFHGS